MSPHYNIQISSLIHSQIIISFALDHNRILNARPLLAESPLHRETLWVTLIKRRHDFRAQSKIYNNYL